MEDNKMNTSNPFKPVEQNFACLLKGKTRTSHIKEIIIETLREIAPQPIIKDQLQKMARVRRTTFLKILDYLIRNHVIVRLGTGTKGDPFKYCLSQSNQPNQQPMPQTTQQHAPSQNLLSHVLPPKKRFIIV
jgi:hypothetical protein